MKKFVLLLLINFGTFAQTYITNVTVADVENMKLLEGKTVIIEGDKIGGIYPATIKIPGTAHIVDGRGKFLFPGLVDAHVHFFQSGGLYTRPDAIDLRKVKPYEREMAESHARMDNVLRRYLKLGITTVADVGATNNFLKRRSEFQGKDHAPEVFISGPLLTTYEPPVFKGLGDDAAFRLVTTPENGRQNVREQLKLNPDFIKIWYIAEFDKMDAETGARKFLPVIQAIIDEAHKNNKRVAVHATERITAQLAVESGCDFLVHSVEDELLSPAFIKLLKSKKVSLCPTLTVMDGYERTFGLKLDGSDYLIHNSDPFQLGSLLDLHHLSDTTLVKNYVRYTNSDKQVAKVKKSNEIMLANLKALSDAGVTIATGTDAGNIGTLHGSSYFFELHRMREAKISNWIILQASTIGGARMLGADGVLGSIAKGKKANMILLDANPVENMNNIMKIHRVINKGIVLDPSKIIEETPEELVQRQLNAYNFRNIEAFLDTYADDVEVYDFPDKLQYRGKQQMHRIYSEMFNKVPNLHCELLGRIVRGNIVIDNEKVRAGNETFGGAAIYHVENGKIKKVYFTL